MMRLAAALELPAAQVAVRKAGGKSYLLVTRYDRQVEPTGDVRRLHQEDFCQALGLPPDRKYQSENGPSFKASFQLLRRAAAQPGVEVLKLADAAIFNVIIGNADAHGKNFSLLYLGSVVTLAPLYDLICTAAYEHLATRFAMKVGTSRTIDEVDGDTWPTFAADVEFTPGYIRKRVRTLSESIQRLTPQVVARLQGEGVDGETLARYASLVTARAARIARTA